MAATGAPSPVLPPSASVCALIPHHGCEAWLAQAIESLHDQTRPPERIVVIDDASEDPPVDIVAAFPEVTLLGVDVNGGPYRLVQAVIDATDFDAYLFQDADDWSAPDRLEVLLATAAETGAGLVGSHEVRVLVDAGDVVGVPYPLDVNAALLDDPAAYPLLHPTSLITRRVLDRLGGFATGMRFSGDAELLRRAAHVARVVNADHHGYFRRKRRGSLSHGSDTALGTPARRAVHDLLAGRARDNARRAARGLPVDLTPWSRAPTPTLHHLVGPPLDARPIAPRRAPPRPALAEPATPATGDPVFVVGGPRSGAGPLAWALGQHPDLVHLCDTRWLVRTCVDLEVRAREEAVRPPPGFRDALAGAVKALAGTPGRRGVAADTELLAAGDALVALFPEARFLHVVRGPDETAAALAETPTDGGAYLGVASTWQAWLDAATDGLALEAALGSRRVLRIDHAELLTSPAPVVERCLAFLGLGGERSCATALRELCDEIPAEPGAAPSDDVVEGDGAAPSHLVAAARDLWVELAAPQLPSSGSPTGRALLRELFDRRQRAGRPTGGSLVERFRALACQVTPTGSTVAVISRGDARLVELPERTGWHLPQVPGGTYAGHHPADSAAALQQLESLHRRGAQYLAVPATDLWWLAYYGGLRDALARGATLVAYQHDIGAVYRLAPAPVADLLPGFVAVLASHLPAGASPAVTR